MRSPTFELLLTLIASAQVLQNLVVALVFFGIGREYSDIAPVNPSVPGDEARVSAELGQAISAHFGILFFVCIGALFGLAQPLLLNFPTERPVFLREHAVGTYSAFPYFLSAMFVEIPIGVIQMLLVYLVTYWVVGLAGNFIYLVRGPSACGRRSASRSSFRSARIHKSSVMLLCRCWLLRCWASFLLPRLS